MNQPPLVVVFSHGKETGPWGTKITAMARVVRELGLAAESVDYQGIDDPRVRVEKLLAFASPYAGRVALAGSSMGGHVSAAAARTLRARGLFVLAPAFYMPGYEVFTPRNVGCPSVVVHGWLDDVVPVANSIRWAQEHRATLHILDSDHRLQDQLDAICSYLRAFLSGIVAAAG